MIAKIVLLGGRDRPKKENELIMKINMKREKKYQKKEEDKQNHRLVTEYRKYQFLLINDLYVYCAIGFYVIQEILS